MRLEELYFEKGIFAGIFKRYIPPNISGIYFLYDKDKHLLYIGKATNIKHRLHVHNTKRKTTEQWYKDVKYIFYYECDKSILLKKEQEEIIRHYPIINLAHNRARGGHADLVTGGLAHTSFWDKEHRCVK